MSEESYILQPGVSIKPEVDIEEVKCLLDELYDIKEVKEISELNGYDDKNFHVVIDGGKNDGQNHEYVFKIINSLDSKRPQFFDAQNCLLLHLRNNGIKCPKPILTNNGEYFVIKNLKSGKHVVRLLEFIKGQILHKISCNSEIFFQAGQFVAKIDEALKDFHHFAYDDYKSLWMMTEIPKLKNFLFAVKNSQRKVLVEEVIDQFSNRVLPVANKLESGMIHGDFNEQNIIVNKVDGKWKIDAIIDFGDSHYSCYLFELAITMMYMILQGKDIDIGGYVLAGYKSIRELTRQEFNLLKICVAARMCQSLVLGAYFSLQDPKNDYLLITQTHGWPILENLWKTPEADLLTKWNLISSNFKRH